jgi:hypothetical protein
LALGNKSVPLKIQDNSKLKRQARNSTPQRTKYLDLSLQFRNCGAGELKTQGTGAILDFQEKKKKI